jgi:hypothetical protein
VVADLLEVVLERGVRRAVGALALAVAGERFRVSGSSDSIGLPLFVVFGMRG